MNRWMRKRIAVLAAVLALATLITGCKKKVKEPTEPVTEPVAATEMTTVPAETLPEETELVTEPVIVAPEAGSITYEAYLNLSAEEQQAYYENFENPEDFLAWLKEAQSENKAETKPAETTNPDDDKKPNIYISGESVEDWVQESTEQNGELEDSLEDWE